MSSFHEVVAWCLVVACGLSGAWCLAAHWLEPLRVRVLWWSIGAAQSLVFIQAFSGAWMVAVEGREVADLHMFYGFLGIMAVGIIFSYRQQMAPHRYLLFGGGNLFIMGLGLQSMQNLGVVATLSALS